MTIKPDLGGQQAPVPAVETAGTGGLGLFDFGPPVGARKRLFQFAKRSRKTPLGPSRSAFGSD